MNFIKPFATKDPKEINRLIAVIGEQSSMASIITIGKDGKPLSSFLPVDFIPSENGFGSVILHLANSNEQLESLRSGGWVLIEFRSPDLYISPSWFKDRNRAPTNMHIVVQCLGHPCIVSDIEEKHRLLDAQVHEREQDLPDNWHPKELQNDGYERRLKAITLVKIQIESAQASVRMLQDEKIENVVSVLSYLEQNPSDKHDWIAKMIKQANAERLQG